MKKLLGFILLVLVALVVGYFYYLHQWQKQVDTIARQVSMLGGELEYRAISLNLQGDVSLEGVFFKVPMQPVVVRIDRLAVHTGGITGVYQLDLDVKNQRLPETLGVSFDGVYLSLSTLTDSANESTFQKLMVAGCGERQVFTEADYRAMGYSEWVMDFHANYRVLGSGAQLQFTTQTHMQEMYSLDMTVTLGLNAASRQLADIAAAQSQIQFIQADMEYQDRGFAERVTDFCSGETGQSREEYIVRHLQDWLTAWQGFGVTPEENAQQAYQQFVQQPNRLRFDITPTPGFNLGYMAQLEPIDWLQFLNIELAVNDQPAVPVSFQMDNRPAREPGGDEQATASEASTGPDTSLPPPTNTEAAPTRIPVSALGEYINEQVLITMRDGAVLTGRIQKIDRDWLHLQSYYSGGYFIQPVSLDDIAQAQLP